MLQDGLVHPAHVVRHVCVDVIDPLIQQKISVHKSQGTSHLAALPRLPEADNTDQSVGASGLYCQWTAAVTLAQVWLQQNVQGNIH